MAITPNERETIAAVDSISGASFYVEGTSSTGAINVNVSGSAGTLDENLAEVGGTAVAVNTGNANNGTQRVVIASDQPAIDVNVTGGASNTQYAEGATTAPGTGTLSLGRYKTTPPTLTDGQLYGLQLDSAGNLKVTGSISVGGTTDNSAYTAGSSTGTPAFGFYHSTIDTVTDGRSAAVAITQYRGQHVNLRNSPGTEVGTTSNPIAIQPPASGYLSTNITNIAGASVGTAASGIMKVGLTDGSGNAITSTTSALDVNIKNTSIAVTQSTSPWVVAGGLTHNNAAPSTNNVGALTALANASTPTFTEGNQTLLSMDLSGRLRIQGTGATGSAVPGIGVYNAGLNAAGNLEGIRTLAASTNTTTGMFASGMAAVFDDVSPTAISENQFGSVRMSSNRNLYNTIRDAAGNERGANVNASNQLSVSIDGSTATNISTNIAQMNGVTVTMGNGTSGTGVQRVTLASDSTGQVAPAANATATGASFSYTAALSSTKTAIDANPGNLYGYHIYNPNSVPIYIQCFNLASASVTVGSTAPSFVIVVPAGGWADSSYPVPITFGTALTVAATTTASGSTAPTTGLTTNFWYK